MINVYTTSHRVKARQELRRAQIKPYTPKEFGGLIAANDKPLEATYVHSLIGRVRRDEFARMYARTSKTQRKHAYSPGDKVMVRRGQVTEIPATVVRTHGAGWYELAVEILGKRCIIKLREPNIHPGIEKPR
jgi:hypothetical protein